MLSIMITYDWLLHLSPPTPTHTHTHTPTHTHPHTHTHTHTHTHPPTHTHTQTDHSPPPLQPAEHPPLPAAGAQISHYSSTSIQQILWATHYRHGATVSCYIGGFRKLHQVGAWWFSISLSMLAWLKISRNLRSVKQNMPWPLLLVFN